MPSRRRARLVGLRIGALDPGPSNAITDVPGVRVGHVSLISGRGALAPGKGPIRTGVTAILPHGGNLFREKVMAAAAVFNGFTKAAGLVQVQELHQVESPILLTNSLSVGRVADAVITAMVTQSPEIGIDAPTVNPVVLECNDGYLNDLQGRHVRAAHVHTAIRRASGGTVEEGTVGAGVGMAGFGFKGGIGTASRRLVIGGAEVTWGALVLVNFGQRGDLMIDGVPVGRMLGEKMRGAPTRGPGRRAARGISRPPGSAGSGSTSREPPPGSVVIVAATDAPVDVAGLERAGRRCAIGLARTGWMGQHGSGDLALAVATRPGTAPVQSEDLNVLFRAAAETTEEAVLNALFTATTVDGRDGHVLEALPVDEVLDILRREGRFTL